MQRIDLKSELDNEWMTQRSVVEMRVGQPNAQNQLDDDDDLKSEWSHLDDKSTGTMINRIATSAYNRSDSFEFKGNSKSKVNKQETNCETFTLEVDDDESD